jgi:hypothetical protein
MKEDTQLNGLLRQWKAPEVSGHFDQDVWRRIRQRQPAVAPAGWLAWLCSPLRLGLAAALLSVTLGSLAGRQGLVPSAPAFAFGAGTTITGAYLQLAKGTHR